MRPSDVIAAAAVSSHDVSTARINAADALGCPARLGVAPHDQRVLPVVRVVATTNTPPPEAVALVEPDGALVRHAHLERVAPPRVIPRGLEEPLQQRARHAPAPLLRMHGDVHDVPRVDVARNDYVA